MDQVVLGKPKPKCSAGRSKVNISSSLVRSTTGLSVSPLLFLAYINDMPETIMHSETQLIADDTILFRAINGTIDSQLFTGRPNRTGKLGK
jgi:hypothetical protein